MLIFEEILIKISILLMSGLFNLSQEKKTKKEKALSKRMRKMLEQEKRLQENEFRQAFFREFWPDNV